MHQIRSVLAAAALHNGAGGTSPSCEGCQHVPAMHQRFVLNVVVSRHGVKILLTY